MSTDIPQTSYGIIYSGLLAGTLSFIAALISALLLYISNKRQRDLQSKLDLEHQSFERLLREFESDLRKKETAESQRFLYLYTTVTESRKICKNTISIFISMIRKSLVADDNEFLNDFNKSIVAFNEFSATASGLKELVRNKDAIFIARMRKAFLTIILGMRLEKERRKLQDFVDKTDGYLVTLHAIELISNAKYRRFLRPRNEGESVKSCN